MPVVPDVPRVGDSDTWDVTANGVVRPTVVRFPAKHGVLSACVAGSLCGIDGVDRVIDAADAGQPSLVAA